MRVCRGDGFKDTPCCNFAKYTKLKYWIYITQKVFQNNNNNKKLKSFFLFFSIRTSTSGLPPPPVRSCLLLADCSYFCRCGHPSWMAPFWNKVKQEHGCSNTACFIHSDKNVTKIQNFNYIHLELIGSMLKFLAILIWK